MTTLLFLLRCTEVGISVWDLDLLTIGLVLDMWTEKSNDNVKYRRIADQADFDKWLIHHLSKSLYSARPPYTKKAPSSHGNGSLSNNRSLLIIQKTFCFLGNLPTLQHKQARVYHPVDVLQSLQFVHRKNRTMLAKKICRIVHNGRSFLCSKKNNILRQLFLLWPYPMK